MYNIDKAIQLYLEKGDDRKIAIYPFGKMGIKTKEILNWRYGITETIIVDNYLANFNPRIISLNEVNDCQEYVWLLTCENPAYHYEIYESLKQQVPESQIIDIFENLLSSGNNNVYSSEYHLLSKINLKREQGVSSPCQEFIELIEKKKAEGRIITVAEIGIGFGASAVEACKLLQKEDSYYCFDYEDKVENLLDDLSRIPEINCTLQGMGNTHKLYDSYSWSLCKLLFKMRNERLQGMFDIVYLDGAHTFLHDAAACCLLKELLKTDGYIIFDDLQWFLMGEGEEQSEWRDLYTQEQLSDRQVQRVVNAFMIEDKRFQQIYMTQSLNPKRAVFKKNDY